MKNIFRGLLLFTLTAAAVGCHNMKVGFLDADNAQYLIDTLVIRKNLHPVKDKIRIENQSLWATNTISSVRGTSPLKFEIAGVTSDVGNADLFMDDLIIIGDGIMFFPLESDAPVGRYKVSVRISNEGYSRVIQDAFTFIVIDGSVGDGGEIDPGRIKSEIVILTGGSFELTIEEEEPAVGGRGEKQYQWYRNGEEIPGATETTYKLGYGENGKYTRKVKDELMETFDHADAIFSEGLYVATPIITISYAYNSSETDPANYTGRVEYTLHDFGLHPFAEGRALCQALSPEHEDGWDIMFIGVRHGSGLLSSATNRTLLGIKNGDPDFWGWFPGANAPWNVTFSGNQNPFVRPNPTEYYIIRPARLLPRANP